MAAPAEVEAPVAVALLGRADDAREQLRRALLDCGAELVFEGDPRETDIGSLMGSQPAVVIVNLDASTEDAVDALQPVFDDPAVNVVFNEADVTRQLEGWDLARWARHLAGKVMGHGDVNPPAPGGAERLPPQTLHPRPGAPPKPAELAGERAIEEFEIEAEEVADAVPTDYMPMAETPHGRQVAPTQDEERLDFDMSGIEDALAEAEQPPQLSPRAVPDAPEGDEDAEAALPPLDLSALEAALQPGPRDAAAEPPEAGDTAAVTGPVSEVAPARSDQEVLDEALSGFDLDADSDAPADFSRFGEQDAEFELDAELNALSESIDRGLEDRSGEAVVDLSFEEDGAALPEDAASPQGPAEEAAVPAKGAVAPAAERPAFDFSALELASLDDEEAAPQQGGKAARGEFDFGSLDLSLEPLEGEQAAQPAPATGAIRRVIVLGASIGGPDALRSFLGAIPKDFPALFLLAQHLDNGFFERLAAQLQKSSRLPVRVPDAAEPARHGEVLVVPGEVVLSVAPDGTIASEPCEEPPRYRPCIDDVLRMAADRFGAGATAIIFSGMAGDAVEGSVYLTSKGGEVWGQRPDSCVVSSMVDGASARGVIEFMGTPRELADYCVHRYGGGA